VKNVLQAAINLAQRQRRRAAGRARWAGKVGTEGVKDAMHATRRSGEGLRDAAVNAGKDVLKRVRRPLRAAARRRRYLKEQMAFNETEWAIEAEIEALAANGRPIVLGPWFSEVGFETLYWLPFLHWVKAALRLEPDRLIAVSRGGVQSWYDGLASRYVEIWDHFDPAEFSRRNAERGITKQHERSSLDDDVLAQVARHLGTSDFDVLHPSLMYKLFTLYWSGQRATGFLDAHLRFTRVVARPVIDPALLPRDYIAVKFYAAGSLPDTPQIRAYLRSTVTALAEQAPVVLLDTGLVLEDDHNDYVFAGGNRVMSARAWMTPQNNLGAQTQIVAGARAFVGTCGSIAWLAPRLGVDTSALYVDPKWLHAHLALAMRAYHRLGAGRFAAADLRALQVLPDAEHASSLSSDQDRPLVR
jgi:hypothetical protein